MFHSNGGLFKTIVLALDRSEGSKRAIPVAAEIAEKEHAKVVIAHVTEYLAAKSGELPHVGEDEIREEITRQEIELADRGIETKGRDGRLRARRSGSGDRRHREPRRC